MSVDTVVKMYDLKEACRARGCGTDGMGVVYLMACHVQEASCHLDDLKTLTDEGNYSATLSILQEKVDKVLSALAKILFEIC